MDVCGGWKWVDYGGCTMESTYLCIKRAENLEGRHPPKVTKMFQIFSGITWRVFLEPWKRHVLGIIGGFLSFIFLSFVKPQTLGISWFPGAYFLQIWVAKQNHQLRYSDIFWTFFPMDTLEKTSSSMQFFLHFDKKHLPIQSQLAVS